MASKHLHAAKVHSIHVNLVPDKIDLQTVERRIVCTTRSSRKVIKEILKGIMHLFDRISSYKISGWTTRAKLKFPVEHYPTLLRKSAKTRGGSGTALS